MRLESRNRCGGAHSTCRITDTLTVVGGTAAGWKKRSTWAGPGADEALALACAAMSGDGKTNPATLNGSLALWAHESATQRRIVTKSMQCNGYCH